MAAVRPLDAIIIGAQKAGTSSLAFYLGQHPEIATHQRLEFSYFADEPDFQAGYPANFNRYFAAADSDRRLLAKSVTVMTEPRLLDRVHQHNPEIELIVLLRDPVQRAYSAFWWARREGYEPIASFEEALDAPISRHRGNRARERATAYRRFGHYATQLENVYARFPRGQVLVFLIDDLKADAVGVSQTVYAAMGVDASFRPDELGKQNVAATSRSATIAHLLNAPNPIKRAVRRALPGESAERIKRRLQALNSRGFSVPPLAADTARELRAYFEPHNRRLQELIGRDLSAWIQSP